MSKITTTSQIELRRITNLVNEGRADVQVEALSKHGGRRDSQRTHVRIDVQMEDSDYLDIVCKTYTPQQQYEDAEREQVMAAERALAFEGRSVSPNFVVTPDSLDRIRRSQPADAPGYRYAQPPDTCLHGILRLELSLYGDRIVCERCSSEWKRDGSS
jgi:hypothetical protein